jgi:CheY-like chemotaxis protein
MPGRTPASVRILLVDDNKAGLAARKSVLEELHYSATTCNDPEDALALFSRAQFDLVVVDYRMPRMNGTEFIEKARKVLPEAGYILLSGFVDGMGLTEQNTGADVVLPKSNNEIAHLVRNVARLVRRKAPRKPPASQRPASLRRKSAR